MMVLSDGKTESGYLQEGGIEALDSSIHGDSGFAEVLSVERHVIPPGERQTISPPGQSRARG